jgi:hypothetical protein
MIDLESNTRMFQGKTEQIEKWTVWWMTPRGLVETLNEAKYVSSQLDMDVNAICIPLVVAITTTSYEVFTPR